MAYFGYEGHKLAYTIHGKGPRTTILMPGLLISQKMQSRSPRDLAAHGNRVVTFDPSATAPRTGRATCGATR